MFTKSFDSKKEEGFMMGDAVTTITITAIVIMLIATIVVGRST